MCSVVTKRAGLTDGRLHGRVGKLLLPGLQFDGGEVEAMPIKHVALKQLRKDAKRTERNRALRSELKTLKKQFLSLLAQGKPQEARQLLPTVMRRFDHAAAKRVVHRNTASRIKSRLMRRLRNEAVRVSTPASARRAEDGAQAGLPAPPPS